MAQQAEGIPDVLTAGQHVGSAAAAAEDYSTLYRHYHPRIFRYCLRMLGNRSDAEDATQEAFIRLSRQLDRVVGDPGPYLSGIAHHVCYDLRHKRHALNVSLDEASDRPARQPDPETEIVEWAFLTEMWGALSDRERTLLAYAFAGFSYDEIASRAAISAKCVSVSITRARQRMRKLAAVASSVAGIPAAVWRAMHRARHQVSTASANTVGTALQIADQGTAMLATLMASLIAGGAVSATAVNVAHPTTRAVAALLQPTSLASDQQRGPTPTNHIVAEAQAAAPATPGSHAPSQAPTSPLLHAAGSALPGGNAGPNDGPYQSIVASPHYASDHTIFASQWTADNCTQCASLLRSTDGGATWVHVSDVGFTGGQILLSPAYPQDDTVFAASPNGLLRSADGGATFTPALPLPSITAAMLPSSKPGDAQILVAPQNQPGLTWIYDAATQSVMAGPALPPGFVPDSATYVENNLLLAGRPGNSTASNDGELVECAPGCAVVADLPNDAPPFHIAVSPTVSTDHTVVVASYTHLYVSHTDGASFQNAAPPAGDALTSVALEPSSSGLLMVLSAFTPTQPRQALVLQSSDGGTTFTTATGGLAHLTSLTPIVALPDGRLLGAVVSDGSVPLYGLRCSTDNGTDWSTVC